MLHVKVEKYFSLCVKFFAAAAKIRKSTSVTSEKDYNKILSIYQKNNNNTELIERR